MANATNCHNKSYCILTVLLEYIDLLESQVLQVDIWEGLSALGHIFYFKPS